jgi:sporulation protein YlmC with PRC-barrel domain
MFLLIHKYFFVVIIMVKVNELKGKKVFAKRGMLIGKVEDVELDETTWGLKSVDVKLEDEVAKLYGAKGGFMTKSVVPLPATLIGQMGEDIMLKEEIKDVSSLLDHLKTPHTVV